jgi:hypothetical protein
VNVPSTEFLHKKHGEMPWNEVEALIAQGQDNLATLSEKTALTWAFSHEYAEAEILRAYGLDLKGDGHVAS